jgi:hypothetical protein
MLLLPSLLTRSHPSYVMYLSVFECRFTRAEWVASERARRSATCLRRSDSKKHEDNLNYGSHVFGVASVRAGFAYKHHQA